MDELKKGLIKLTDAEKKALEASNMELEKEGKMLPNVTTGPNGLKKPFSKVDDDLMEVAERVQNAEYVQRYIRDGRDILQGGFIYEDGTQKFSSSDANFQCYLPVESSPMESQEEVQSDNVKEEDITLDLSEQSIKTETDQGNEPKTATTPHTSEDKDFAQKDVYITGEVLFVPQYGIEIQLLEIQKTYTDDGKSAFASYIFLVKTWCGHQEIEVPGNKLLELDWLKRAADGLLYLEAKVADKIKKQLILFIQKNTVRQTRRYEGGGWKKVENMWGYVLARGIINRTDYSIIGGKDYEFPPRVEGGEAEICHKIFEMMSICQNPAIMLILMFYVQLSFLSTIFSFAGAAVKFIVTLVGETNSRKTTLALLLAKVFVANEKLPDATFSATLGGIEMAVYECIDRCMILDDMKPGATKTENKEMAKKLELVTRLFGDRTPKKRMVGYGSDGEFQVGGGCIVTGEHIDGVESSRTRRVNVAITRNEVNNELLSEFQETNYWSSYLYYWLSYITLKIDDAIKFIKSEFGQLRKQGKFKIDRRNDQFAQLSISASLFLSYAVECGVLSLDDAKQKYIEMQDMIFEVLCQNEEETKAESVLGIMLEAFYNHAQQYAEPMGLMGTNTEKIYQDENFFFVSIEVFLTIANKYAEKIGASVALPSARLLPKMLDEENIIEVKKEGDKIRRTLHLPGHATSTRFLWISKDNLEMYIHQIEQ